MKKIIKNTGISLVEILVTMTIVTLCLLALLHTSFFIGKQSLNTKEKTFATQKVLQIMEELRSLVIESTAADIRILDDYDDGVSYNSMMTADKSVTNPNDPLSRNIQTANGWKYLRKITVRRLPNEPLARRVYVRIYLASPANPTQPGDSLAETISIIKTIGSDFKPTQVMDIYALALENVPGWWSAMSTLRPMFESVIQDIQTRNPGLELRVNWITQLANGRDTNYRPYSNRALHADDAAIPWVYYYAGLLERPASGDFFYFPLNNLRGRLNIDGVINNPTSYAFADQYNHGVRYPEESGDLTLRRFLEEINTQPNRYRNCLIVDLHGELIPLPPMRNYSDPAKDNINFPQHRLVTHPEQLYYVAGSSVTLRVYTYLTDYPNAIISFADDLVLPDATIHFPNAAITSGNITIQKLVGNATTAYAWETATLGTEYLVTTGTATWITLIDSPMRHSWNSSKGIKSEKQLYGLEYIPCPVEAANDFSQDLTFSGNRPKNTARWRITINPGILNNGRHTIETRIWDGIAPISGAYNLSRTYVWIGIDPPITEQYQFLGDPRHMPYKDAKAAHAYNWYFTNTTSSFSDYGGFSKISNGWEGGGGKLNIDIPRYFQLYRQGLLRTGGIWTNMTGFSFYYAGIGGEMGADAANGFPAGLPIHEQLWNPSGTGTANVDEITSATNSRIIASTNNDWYSRYWLGELWPDNEYANWLANGNLSSGSGNYKRANYSTFFGFNPVKRTQVRGCSSFINGKPSALSGPFNHEYRDGDAGALTAQGLTLSQTFNFPLLNSINASRPATLSYGSRYPPEWNDAVYSGQRITTSWVANYYNAPFGTDYFSAGLVKGTDGLNTAYFTILGVDKQTNFGASQIARLSLSCMIRGFMDAGAPAVALIDQVPRVIFTAPNPNDDFDDPGIIPFTWDLEWKKWDGQPYTTAYPNNYVGTAPIVYSVKYSNDNGTTWRFADDNSIAQPGEKNLAHTTNLLTFNWTVTGFPKGTYLVRVEAYRTNIDLHYSYHQMRFYLNNP